MAPLCHYLTIKLILLTSALFVSAKISGGPRGRFSRAPSGHHYHVSASHAHYSYHPPSHINYMCRYCANAATYPVYHSAPPTYIYKFRESDSRYGTLLTGLALYNLGRCCGNSHLSANYYTPYAEEMCSLQVIDPHRFEETRFPCFMMSSFMESSNKSKSLDVMSLKNANETHVEEIKPFDILTAQVDVKPYLNTSNMALEVHRDQECVIWHNKTLNKERHHVPCALLEQYAETMKPSGVPVYVWMPTLLLVIVSIYICGYCCCRRRRDKREDTPLNQTTVLGYYSNYY